MRRLNQWRVGNTDIVVHQRYAGRERGQADVISSIDRQFHHFAIGDRVCLLSPFTVDDGLIHDPIAAFGLGLHDDSRTLQTHGLEILGAHLQIVLALWHIQAPEAALVGGGSMLAATGMGLRSDFCPGDRPS